MKNPWIVIGGLVVVLFGGSIAYSMYAGQAANEGVEPIDVHVKGNPDGVVTLAKYSDFSCPACGQAYLFAKEVVETYADDIRFEYKHFAFLDLGEPAALAAEAAGQQDAFFEYHDLMFENQNQWLRSSAPQRYFEQYAEELGLDVDQWNQQRGSSVLRSEIRADMEEGRSLGVTGTPTFFLNGERMEYQTFDEFRDQVEAALEAEGVETVSGDEHGDMGIELDGEGTEDIEIEVGDPEAETEAEAGAEGDVEFGI